MALTPQEQQELNQLNARSESQPTGGLTKEEAFELRELNARADDGPASGRVASEPIPKEEIQRQQVQSFLQQKIESGEIKQREPTLFERVQQEIPQTAGGIAGSIATMKMAQPKIQQLPPQYRIPATLVAGMAGSFGGGFLGKAGQEAYEHSLTGEPISYSDLLQESSIAGLEEAAGELVGFGLGKAIGKGAKALRGLVKLKPGAKAAAKIATEGGTVATKGQLTKGRLGEMFEGFAEKFIFGGSNALHPMSAPLYIC